MAPGPNNILVLQSAMRSRKLGIAAALGVWPVGIMWAAACLLGLGTLLLTAPRLVSAMTVSCGAYLLWLGLKSLRHSFLSQQEYSQLKSSKLSLLSTLRAGMITNMTNPKTVAYFMSVYAATDAASMPMQDQMIAIVMLPSISFIWYAFLSVTVASKALQRRLEHHSHWIDRVSGLVMIGFGLKLLCYLF